MNAAERVKALAWVVWCNATAPHSYQSAQDSLAAFNAWWEANADTLVCPACSGTGCIEIQVGFGSRSAKDLACPLDCKACCGSPGWGLA